MKKKKEVKKQATVIKPNPVNKYLSRFSWLIITAVVFIAYGQTIGFSYAMDDGLMIENNTAVQKGFSGIPLLVSKSSLFYFEGKNSGSYRPITMSSFAITTALFHNNPHKDHFVNLVLYCLCCIFLLLSLQRMLPTWHPALHLGVVLLFLLHPVHTEVVANVKSRDELLCFLGCFGALYFLLRYVSGSGILNILFSCMFYVLALGSKENAIPFLLMFPAVLWFFTKTDWKKIISATAPLLLLAIIFLVIRAAIVKGGDSESQISMIDNSLLAATSPQDKYATIFFIILKYLQLLFYPNPLVFDYSYNQVPVLNFGDPKAIFGLILVLGLLIVAVLGIKRRSIYSFSILFFFINMIAVLNVVIMISATMAERFLFLPSLAFCLVFVSLLIKIFKTNVKKFSFNSQMSLTAVMVIVLALYSFKTYSRSMDWRNNRLLFEAAIRDSPNSTRSHGSLGYELTEGAIASKDPQEKKQLFDRAIVEYKRALEIYDRSEKAWYNYGHALYEMGSPDEAFKIFSRAVELDASDIKAWNNMGAISLQHGKYEEAMKYFDKGLAVNPNEPDLNANKGACYQYLGNFEEAKKYYERALELNPNHVNARNNLNGLLHRNDSGK